MAVMMLKMMDARVHRNCTCWRCSKVADEAAAAAAEAADAAAVAAAAAADAAAVADAAQAAALPSLPGDIDGVAGRKRKGVMMVAEGKMSPQTLLSPKWRLLSALVLEDKARRKDET